MKERLLFLKSSDIFEKFINDRVLVKFNMTLGEDIQRFEKEIYRLSQKKPKSLPDMEKEVLKLYLSTIKNPYCHKTVALPIKEVLLTNSNRELYTLDEIESFWQNSVSNSLTYSNKMVEGDLRWVKNYEDSLDIVKLSYNVGKKAIKEHDLFSK